MRWIKFIKVPIFLACLVPVGLLVRKAMTSDLGANPLEVITHSTGDWTLTFLLLTLAITPLRKLTTLHWLIRFRRMMGLYAFFYGVLHLLTYLVFDRYAAGELSVSAIAADVAKRPFIMAGFAAFVLMVPLALTSTRGMIRRLGKRWATLHRLIYLSAIAGVVHYWWLVKKDVTKPMRYAVILGALLGYRLVVWIAARRGMHVRELDAVTAEQ